MLKKAQEKMPKKTEAQERFEIPFVKSFIEGNKTIISNFPQIASALGREIDHLLKYMLRELATPGEMKNNLLILGTKIPANRINEKLAQYSKEFVICKECGKPDTKIIKENDFYFLKCLACGARQPVKR